MCEDLSKPVRVASRMGAEMAAILAERDQWARYAIVGSKYSDTTPLGRGYRLTLARALAAVMQRACDAARPTESAWTKPYFGVELIAPRIAPITRARFGDLAAIPVEMPTANPSVSRAFVTPGFFVGLSGSMATVLDLDGQQRDGLKLKGVIPADQFDIGAARAELLRRHARGRASGYRCPSEGGFANLKEISVAVERYQPTGAPSRVDAKVVASVIQRIGAYRPLPIDIPDLQSELDAVLAGADASSLREAA